ncbi:WbqC family protein [Lacibacter sp.]|uniref:WbqC family protein n=1 Tax=Lacibacter sp. TaxID=1915409 RepID=UPI002B4AE86D|nr:WbqC family protein [Lacibacter sp.]HLP39774.1 WbqC family protein [Lacibacter sp.]
MKNDSELNLQGNKSNQTIDLHYFGDIYSYLKFINQTNVYFSAYESYFRALHLNRTKLMGANGPLPLSVPLEGGRNQKVKWKDVKINYAEPWQRIHWRGIHDNYRKAPWFEDYAPDLEQLFLRKEKYLLDLNLKTMDYCLQRLKLKVDILAYSEEEAAKLISRRPEKSEPIPSENFPVYQQVFSERHGFVPNLGILDLLFCEGPLATDYLRRIKKS